MGGFFYLAYLLDNKEAVVLFSKKKSLAHQRVSVKGDLPAKKLAFYLVLVIVWTGFAVLAGVFFSESRGGGGQGGADQQVLTSRLAQLESQLQGAHEKVRAIDSSVLLESTAKETLAEQLRQVRQENTSLREELALFETMSEPGGDARYPMAVSRVKVDAIAGDRYRYKGVVFHRATGRQGKEFQGEYHLELRVRRSGGDVMITVPSDLSKDGSKKIAVRSVFRVEGEFQLRPGDLLTEGVLVVTQNGVIQAKGVVLL